MALVKIAGMDSTSEFNSIFSAAHARCITAGGHTHEPHFVRHLISKQTVEELNNVCPALYDSTKNKISFRAAFLHQSPFACFTPPGGSSLRRELADAMFVLYETEPNVAGVHTVVRRSACMLMFKASDARLPQSFAFDPAAKVPPVGSDEEQFFLFNQWPAFDLETGRRKSPKKLGTYEVASQGTPPNSVAHDVGQFALVWQSPTGGNPTWAYSSQPVHWLAGAPVPNQILTPQNASLGTLLDRFVTGNAGVGRDFDPRPPNEQTWNGLMGTLLGYPMTGPVLAGSPFPIISGHLADKTWASQLRDVNPAGLGFMTLSQRPLGMGWLEGVGTASATLLQHSRDVFVSHPWLHWSDWAENWHHQAAFGPLAPDSDEAASFPVLIATVNRFHPRDERQESLRMTLSERAKACRGALQSLAHLTRDL